MAQQTCVATLNWTNGDPETCDGQVFDGKSGDEVSRHEMDGNLKCLAVTHDGNVVSIGMESGKVEKNLLPEVDFDDFVARCELPAGSHVLGLPACSHSVGCC